MRHDESLMKPKDVAELLNVSGTWVYDAADKGLLPHR
jgi:predicted DNA-binding transcriptional regulator AlpA